ncbi:MAG TPA: transcription/translation regulatory transformer protein RfaH [Pseudomonas sp.]|uniref:transcription/translation regulatory transformer protein RfaH n=1 Tax=Pseudomonas sp. TaxID=306 RepID=UPI000ECC5FF6|nr:transcription/translation regulatory transformer protein RfaH [Pseudomonas sp.]HCS07033.1 transcription/translation regulatory transformer protein RfaH [Pseudomonas sp.]
MDLRSNHNAPTSVAPKQGDWYLVQCKPQQDERAEENLVRQGFGCSRPVCRRERLLRGKRQIIEESLFPGYLFIHMPAGSNWSPLRSTRGVARIVAFGGRPLAVADELIETLQARVKTQLISQFTPGEHVVIKDHGFEGIESIFMAMEGDERVILLINLLNRQQQISLPLASIASR